MQGSRISVSQALHGTGTAWRCRVMHCDKSEKLPRLNRRIHWCSPFQSCLCTPRSMSWRFGTKRWRLFCLTFFIHRSWTSNASDLSDTQSLNSLLIVPRHHEPPQKSFSFDLASNESNAGTRSTHGSSILKGSETQTRFQDWMAGCLVGQTGVCPDASR